MKTLLMIAAFLVMSYDIHKLEDRISVLETKMDCAVQTLIQNQTGG